MDLPGRLKLHDILVKIGGENVSVYFQPPNNLTMNYPCIVYNRDSADQKYANNRLYLHKLAYSVTYISRDPDEDVPDKIRELEYCRFRRHFQTEGLHHDVFTIYY